MMRSKGFTGKVLPVLLGSTGEPLKSTLLDLKLAAPGADRISFSFEHPCTGSRCIGIIQAAGVQKQNPHCRLSRIANPLSPHRELVISCP